MTPLRGHPHVLEVNERLWLARLSARAFRNAASRSMCAPRSSSGSSRLQAAHREAARTWAGEICHRHSRSHEDTAQIFHGLRILR